MSTTAIATSPAQDRRPEQQPRGLLPKKCRYCERRFSKAEHLKRHQRSHTGERPYTCPRCQKSFSRSDVLIRHLKNHPQIVGEEIEKSSSEGDFIEVNGAPNPNQPPVASSENNPATQNVRRQSQVVASPSVIDPSLEDHLPRPTSNGLPSGLDHLALLASQQKWDNGTMDAVMTDSGNAALPEMSAAPSWTLEMPNNNHVAHPDVNFDPRPAQPDPNFQNIGPSPNTSSRFNFGEDIYSARLNGMQDQISPDMGGMAPDVSIMPQDLQTWFDQFDLESHLHPGNLQDFGSSNSQITGVRRGSSFTTSDEPASVRNPSSPSTLIPNERFAKVERCWPNRHSNPLRLMPTLWWDAVLKAEDNLFSNGNLSPEAMEQNRQCGSRWGLDEDCRERLQRMFVTITHVSSDQTPAAAFGSPENFSSPSESRSAGQAPSVVNDAPLSSNFPPAEIFDIGLDLYFRQFHPLMPFIHTPTFCPKTAPTSILFIMCLIGLTILQTKGATAFVRQTFSKALEQVSIELMPSLSGDRSRIDQMSSLASAVLILNLTEMMGQKYHQSQCQMLYANVIMTAQKHGLFNANDGQPLNEGFFGQISDLEARWKAWSRIECAKRLIVSLTMVDTWYSAMLHTSPIMRTDDIQIILPCDAALFQATTATKWAHLAATRHQICMPMVSLSNDMLTLPELNNTLEPLAMHGILSIIRLRISHDFHRLLSGCHRRADEQYFVPALTYDLDPRAKQTKSLVIHVMKSYDQLFTSMNPNCIVLWHNTCIMLTSDIRLFEIGAGCAGAPAARQALDDISAWTQTPSARRACLHAAQTFKLMSNRRASDGDPFHASTGLFISALILGLYVFMVPPESDSGTANPGSGFDLIDDVDWTVVGGEGLGAPSPDSTNPSMNSNMNINTINATDDAAVNFIRNGGGICFDGVIHRPGYEAARRILLDYARLLEDIGRWRVRISQYSKVLRIMSDALVDVEMGGG
ncbi:hypothetical protein DL98DRAFT_562340 [Cadophora sp. DSE1049]|nr:hypothetical protein DL98DRAFT_562340 [Cadophora sp. DSE1049]